MFGSRVSWLSWFRAYAECNPYNVSSCKGRTEVVRLLLGHSANVHAKNKAGRTPIQAASGEEKGEIIQMLTKHGAQIR